MRILYSLIIVLVGCDPLPHDMEYGRCIEVCLAKSANVQYHLPGACVCSGTDIVVHLKPLPKEK